MTKSTIAAKSANKAATKETKMDHPSVLAVVRSHNVSGFPFNCLAPTTERLFDLDVAHLAPVELSRETVRATQSSASTPAEKKGVGNIQRMDFARLPANTGAMLISGSVLVTAHSRKLEISNEAWFTKAHQEFITAFAREEGYDVLAERYVMNMLNGSILFRNRIGFGVRCALSCEGTIVEVAESDLQAGYRLSLADIIDPAIRESVRSVVAVYAKALSGERGPLVIQLRAYVEMGVEQDVYPSQEFAEESKSKEEGKISRVLAQALRSDGIRQAAFHGRKISNAIRTIDTWYPNASKALPIEPYAVDQSAQNYLRTAKVDFYAYMMQLPVLTAELNEGNLSDAALFTAACFIRGGVFSKAKTKAAKDAE